MVVVLVTHACITCLKGDVQTLEERAMKTGFFVRFEYKILFATKWCLVKNWIIFVTAEGQRIPHPVGDL